MNIKLIDNWKGAWKFVTVQIAAVILFLPTLLPYMGDIAQYVPHNWYQWLGGAILVARIIKQRVDDHNKECPKDGGKDEPSPVAN